MDPVVPLNELADRARASFQQRFGRPASYVVAAPGRVNLIGEHTDYNDGFVLPMAIDRYTVFAADVSDSAHAHVYSQLIDEQQDIPLSGGDAAELPVWTRYIRGVFDAYAEIGIHARAFDAVVDSTVPLGSGLSSSAALEVATATLLESLAGKSVAPVRKALLCQLAEHRGAGVPCGIMDQFSSVLCQAGHLMLLDCRSQATKMVPLVDPSIKILIINSNVTHELTGGEYAERRSQCAAAAKALGVSSLRDASMAMLAAEKDRLDVILCRRARHVISEIERTTTAATSLEAGAWDHVGSLMYASHGSLRDDYEVSCPELDTLVASAKALDARYGVIGSRMTGGGFGGCTVSLVNSETAAMAAEAICASYCRQTGVEATAFATTPAQGATVLVEPH